jgi:hypothetical protein
MIDEVFSGTAKADRVPSDMDNNHNMGVEDQPPSQEEEPESPRTRACNLLGVRGQRVKRRKFASGMAASLDRLCEYTRRTRSGS